MLYSYLGWAWGKDIIEMMEKRKKKVTQTSILILVSKFVLHMITWMSYNK